MVRFDIRPASGALTFVGHDLDALRLHFRYLEDVLDELLDALKFLTLAVGTGAEGNFFRSVNLFRYLAVRCRVTVLPARLLGMLLSFFFRLAEGGRLALALPLGLLSLLLRLGQTLPLLVDDHLADFEGRLNLPHLLLKLGYDFGLTDTPLQKPLRIVPMLLDDLFNRV